MYSIIKRILFLFDPEKVHYFIFDFLKFYLKIPGVKFFWKKMHRVESPLLETTVAGIKFPNPVGLAAGLDKNALLINELAACGFGFVEIGTVTPVGQPGNDKKRLFRLIPDEAIINRMGLMMEYIFFLVKIESKNEVTFYYYLVPIIFFQH